MQGRPIEPCDNGIGCILIWNIRGLNARSQRNVVCELIIANRPSVVCIEETKMHVISYYYVLKLLGSSFDYLFLPAEQTHGGILVVWRDTVWTMSAPSTCRFSLSTRIRNISEGEEWWLTFV
jgi:exonuclease III